MSRYLDGARAGMRVMGYACLMMVWGLALAGFALYGYECLIDPALASAALYHLGFLCTILGLFLHFAIGLWPFSRLFKA